MYLPWRGSHFTIWNKYSIINRCLFIFIDNTTRSLEVLSGDLVSGLEAGVGDLGDGELLVVGLLRGDDGRVGRQREVDARVWYQVRLELCQVHVQCAVETQRRSDRRHNLWKKS